MEVNEQNFSSLATLLQNSISPQTNLRQEAERQLKSIETQPGYSILVLKFIANQNYNHILRLGASIILKNFIKKEWELSQSLKPEDKELIKSNIIDLMLTVTDKPIQSTLSEIISIISEYDFYKNWPNLLAELVARMKDTGFDLIKSVLYTCHSIFLKYREQDKTDEIEDELIFIMNNFAEPMLLLFNGIMSSIPTLEENAIELKKAFSCIQLLLEIFYSLNWVDIPEYFENHLDDYVKIFDFLLKYENKHLESDNDLEEGLIDNIKKTVCLCINLYLEKYDEQFLKYVEQFATIIWGLLSKISQHVKHDGLVSKALEFLTFVARSEKHVIFGGALPSICDNIIIPNVTLRDEDEEIFEDDPIEYIRRDIEGSDTDTRRRSAQELVKYLSIYFEKEITDNFIQKIQNLLQQSDWKSKDVAIFLVTAISVKASIQRKGVTSVNQYVDVMNFLNHQIIPEIQSDKSHPILKADAIKFICIFRQHLPKQLFQVIFPLLTNLLTSQQSVVQTYAAWCIERLLTVKDDKQLRYTSQDLLPFANTLFGNLFLLLGDSNENEYVMKAIMRVTSILKENMKPILPQYISQITNILERVCKNPSNPMFNHYLFESYATVIKFNSDSIAEFETSLFPVFQTILNQDIEEFTPYVFQLLSQLLAIRQVPIPDLYVGLFPNFLSVHLWANEGNIPGLVSFISSLITRAPEEVLKGNQLEQVLGIFHTLVMQKTKDYHGFRILDSLISALSFEQINRFVVTIFQILFTRMQKRKTGQFLRCLILFCSNFVVRYGPNNLIQVIDQVQQGLFPQIVKAVWESSLQKITGKIERKVSAVAVAQLLCSSNLLQKYPESWEVFCFQLVKFLELPADKTEDEEEEDIIDDSDSLLQTEKTTTGYKVTFTKLSFAARGIDDPVKNVQNAKVYFAQALNQYLTQLQQSSPQDLQVIKTILMKDTNIAQCIFHYLQTNGFNSYLFLQ
ncbi:hypothetical protein ABK040_007825 [Willaertia magna]